MDRSVIQWSDFKDLTLENLCLIFAARQEVFIVEQNCPYLDCDNLDQVSSHIILWVDHEIAGYLRIVPPKLKYDEPSIGRVLTTGKYRGIGLGKKLMAEGIKRAKELFSSQSIRINAQSRLIGFYQEFGFKVDSEEYLEDDIPHVEMLLEVKQF
jgi:ElaA protein